MKTLSVIGAGKVGRTLAHLLHRQHAVTILDVITRSQKSAEDAAMFIGCGRPMTRLSTLAPADMFMLACPDDQINTVATELHASGVVNAGSIVFHCSGAKSSELLTVLKTTSHANIASLHPIKSFSDPAKAIESFSGTYCGIEGDAEATEVLFELARTISGIPFELDTQNKTLYHAASVIACNYLVALQEVSLQSFAESGVEEKLALNILEPLVRGTVNNIFSDGTSQSLTGPIARGDIDTVSDQLSTLQNWRLDYGEIYRLLGKVALDLTDKNPPLEHKEQYDAIRRLLLSNQ